MASISSYKKMFICEVLKSIVGLTALEVSQTILKTQVMGVVTGIKRFPESAIFSLDDGTGTLDCILWSREPASQERIFDLKKDAKSGITQLSRDMKSCALSLLQKAEMSTVCEEMQCSHGDVVFCMGNVKLFRGKPQLDIQHHYKGSDVNAESLWILDVLATKQAM